MDADEKSCTWINEHQGRKMNIYINLSKKRIAAVIFTAGFMLLGLQMFVTGAANTIGIRHSRDIKELELSELKKGIYVQGEVTYVLGSYYKKPSGGTGLLTCMTEWVYGPREYAVPVNESQYITLYVEKPYFEIFRKFTDAPNAENGYSFYGKTVPRKAELNYRFLKNALQITNEQAVEQRISKDYGIQILEPEQEKKRLMTGFLLMTAELIFLVILIKDRTVCLPEYKTRR